MTADRPGPLTRSRGRTPKGDALASAAGCVGCVVTEADSDLLRFMRMEHVS